MAEMVARRDQSIADIVELRLDAVERPDVSAALAGRAKPVVITCRPDREGGGFSGPERDRLDLLARAVLLGAEYVDIESTAHISALPDSTHTRTIVSLHDFSGVPDDLPERVRRLREQAGRGIVKVAVTASSPADCIALRDAVADDAGDHVAIGMGAGGTITRVCPWLFGSIWTYAGAVAPGQIDVATSIERYRVRETSASTKLFALTGAPLGHSASPAMFNAAFAALGLDAVYVPIEAPAPAEFLRAAEAFGIEGASVTAPLKRGWESAGLRVDALAARVGAVNTLKRKATGWEGRNFDVAGFLAPLERRARSLRGIRAVVLGAGGAARAAAHALTSVGATVAISARRQEAATALAAALGVLTTPWPPAPPWDLLVNATPAGTYPRVHETPLEGGWSPWGPGSKDPGLHSDGNPGSEDPGLHLDPGLHSDQGRALVYDLVYNPRETRLLRDARQAGFDTIGGLEMLVAQAERQFEYWTGRPAPAGVMARAAATFLDGDRA
jgi:3-dehydroquinate dehydratase/shikimate dehydrogenase